MSAKTLTRYRSVQRCYPVANATPSRTSHDEYGITASGNEVDLDTHASIREIRIDMLPLLQQWLTYIDTAMPTPMLHRRIRHVDRARAREMPTLPISHIQFDIASAMPTLPRSLIQFDSASAMPTSPTSSTQVDSATARPALPRPSAEPTTNLTMYVPLYQAALTGNWNKAKEFIGSNRRVLAARITKGGETAPHIAAGAKQTKFVEELVNLMDAEDLALQNKANNTALCFAAASGITRIAEIMVKKNENLPAVRGSNGVTALYMAALLGYRDMVKFLKSATDPKHLTNEDYIELLLAAISSDLYDVALEILLPRKELAIQRDSNDETALHVLARKPSVFSGTSQLGVWQRCIYSWIHMQTPDASRNASSLFKYHNRKNSQGMKDVREEKLQSKEALKLLKCLWEQVLLLDDSRMGDLLKSPS